MSNEQLLSMPYAIHLSNDIVYIENKRQNKMISISRNTFHLRQENSGFKKLKTMDKVIETQGILGIIELMNSHFLIYISNSNPITSINGSQINQITQTSFIPLSKIPNDLIDNHKATLNSFQKMIAKGMYYYSSTYDLTNLYQYQRGYIDYRIAKTDYLWNNNFLSYFISNYIQVELFFVFCICGYIKSYASSLQKKPLVHYFIARKKRFNFKTNHTQMESIISYNATSIFTYVMYSFGYSSDIVQGETICVNNFKKYYGHYNQPKYKTANTIINIVDNNYKTSNSNSKGSNSISDAGIKQIIVKTFDKAKLFQFNCVKEFLKEVKAFITGILGVVHAFEFNMINKTYQQDIETEGEIVLTQESRLQKGFFLIISCDGHFSPIQFERYLLWEVIELFLSKFQMTHNSDDMFSNLNNEIKKCFSNEDINRDIVNLNNDHSLFGINSNRGEKQQSPTKVNKLLHKNTTTNNNKPIIKWIFKEKYESMFDDYLKQTVSIDRFNDYTAMNYFLIEQRIKQLVNVSPNNILTTKEDLKKEEKMTVYIATWNVGALSIQDNQDISPLLHPLNYCGFLNKNPVDLYLIGLQEIVKLNPHLVLFASNEAVVNYWIAKIAKEIPNYDLVTSMTLVGVLFLVFSRRSIKSDLRDVQTQIIKTGFFGTLGNKGSCSIRFTFHKRHFALASGHLSAGDGENEQRISQLNNIASTVFDNGKCFSDVDYWFIFGDMNFRIELDTTNVLLYIESSCLGFLKANDQLIQNKKKFEFEYEEEDIFFAPSYKYFPKTNKYTTKRTPSWCDRIIYKPSKHIKALAYDKIEILCSDHMPVMGIFQVTISE